MKWFKHLTIAMDDLFIKDLEREFGDAGYAFWFKTLELIGAHGEGGTLTISWANYCEKLHKKRSVLEQMLAYSQSAGKLRTNGGPTADQQKSTHVTIECQKFAEYCDNYTKYGKSLQSDFKEPLKQEERIEEEEKKKEKRKRESKRTPDSLDLVLLYSQEIGLTPLDANAFFDHYEANGWVQGRQGKPIVDWKAAARRWKSNKEKYEQSQNFARSGNASSARVSGTVGKYAS